MRPNADAVGAPVPPSAAVNVSTKSRARSLCSRDPCPRAAASTPADRRTSPRDRRSRLRRYRSATARRACRRACGGAREPIARGRHAHIENHRIARGRPAGRDPVGRIEQPARAERRHRDHRRIRAHDRQDQSAFGGALRIGGEAADVVRAAHDDGRDLMRSDRARSARRSRAPSATAGQIAAVPTPWRRHDPNDLGLAARLHRALLDLAE